MIDKQAIFNDLDRHLCQDKKPSIYLEKEFRDERLKNSYPFNLLADLQAIQQSPQHHPEGDVWKHTLLVVDCAAERKYLSESPRILMWAALLHDLGKVPATKVRKGRITAYDHDKYGEILAAEFLSALGDDQPFIDKVAKMVRWHMQILFVVKKLPFADVETMLKEVDINEIALLSWCDRLGRGEMTEAMMQAENENVVHFLNECQAFMRQGQQV